MYAFMAITPRKWFEIVGYNALLTKVQQRASRVPCSRVKVIAVGDCGSLYCVFRGKLATDSD
jgi:hypothetical protein